MADDFILWRDIYPIEALPVKIIPRERGLACEGHSKHSDHRPDRDEDLQPLRNSLIDGRHRETSDKGYQGQL